MLRVCEIKDLIWVMRFQSPLVYKSCVFIGFKYISVQDGLLHIKMGALPCFIFELFPLNEV